MNDRYDFLIVGSGFASCVLALVLQRMGYRCLLVEAHRHPRFAIGESSTPIADQILLDLGQDFQLPELTRLARWSSARHLPNVVVGCKQGFTYFFADAARQDAAVPMLLVPASPTEAVADSHWHRASVDQYLARSAVARGVELREATRVVGLQRCDNCWRVELASNHSEGELDTVYAGFLVDGSGPAAVVSKLLADMNSTTLAEQNVRKSSFGFATHSGSLFGHFYLPVEWDDLWKAWHLPVEKFSFPPQRAAVHHVTSEGWMWHLGFDNQIVSLGWVLPADQLEADQRLASVEGRWEFWETQLARYPHLHALYGSARMVDPPGGLGLIRRQQRFHEPISGLGWVALPNTVGFVDPLHSTGIAHSLCAVQKIVRALNWQRVLDESFVRVYADRLKQEFWLVDQLVAAAYSSLGHPEKWEAATMLYFAAAIQFEEWRDRHRVSSHGRSDGTQLTSAGLPQVPWRGPDFLMADQVDWLERVVRGRSLLQRPKPPRNGWLGEMASILGPMNTVGLCDPSLGGIYHYTVANK
ncbi:MAG: tryptophan 7-halogenase [Planctomycetaceae bacterium]|nr:tryptophan 7-halogenase [Planctomycetaceae bacterium]